MHLRRGRDDQGTQVEPVYVAGAAALLPGFGINVRLYNGDQLIEARLDLLLFFLEILRGLATAACEDALSAAATAAGTPALAGCDFARCRGP